MFNYCSNKICKILLDNKQIEEDELELYKYGFFLLLSNIFFTILIIVLGLLFGNIFETLIFYISFCTIRHFAGGYHANTEIRCDIITTLFFTVSVFLISLSEQRNIKIIVLFLSALSVVTISVLSPLDTPAKPLDSDEKKKYRRISLIILSVIVVLIIISYIFKIKYTLIPCCISLILEAVLLLAGKIKGQIVKT